MTTAPNPDAPAPADERANWEHLIPFGYAPGNYNSRCFACNTWFVGDKRARSCRPCAEASHAKAVRDEALRERAEQVADDLGCHMGEPTCAGCTEIILAALRAYGDERFAEGRKLTVRMVPAPPLQFDED